MFGRACLYLFFSSFLPSQPVFAFDSFLYFVVVHIQAKEKTAQVSTFHDLQGKEVRNKPQIAQSLMNAAYPTNQSISYECIHFVSFLEQPFHLERKLSTLN